MAMIDSKWLKTCPVCEHNRIQHYSMNEFVPIPCIHWECRCRFYEDYEHDKEYAAFREAQKKRAARHK